MHGFHVTANRPASHHSYFNRVFVEPQQKQHLLKFLIRNAGMKGRSIAEFTEKFQNLAGPTQGKTYRTVPLESK